MTAKLNHEELKAAVMAMPFVDRSCLLIMSVMQHEKEPVAVVNGLIGLISEMLRYYSTSQKYLVASKLRDIADNLERVPREYSST